MKKKICTECGYVGEAISQRRFSLAIDGVFWLLFIFSTAITQFIFLLLIPLAWTLFQLTQFDLIKCPHCSRLDMIHLNSPKGKEKLKVAHPIHLVCNNKKEPAYRIDHRRI